MNQIVVNINLDINGDIDAQLNRLEEFQKALKERGLVAEPAKRGRPPGSTNTVRSVQGPLEKHYCALKGTTRINQPDKTTDREELAKRLLEEAGIDVDALIAQLEETTPDASASSTDDADEEDALS